MQFQIIPGNTPLTIIVHNGRYDVYGPETERSKSLKDILDHIGGISDTVADGTYEFNVEMVDELPIATLSIKTKE